MAGGRLLRLFSITRLAGKSGGEACKMTQSRYWFSRRTTGRGRGIVPSSREGWIATIIFVIVDGGGAVALVNTPTIMDTKPWVPIVWALDWFAAFLALMLAKCEPKR
jgi:hypothetical protein